MVQLARHATGGGLALGFAVMGCTSLNPAFNLDSDGDWGDTVADTSHDTSLTDASGDGDPGDGDGDPGDGDGDTGDGDGDPGDGDGDGDGDPGDGDGDGDGDPACGAPVEYKDCDLVNGGLTTSPFAALGLGCPGLPDQGIAVAKSVMNAVDPASWRIARSFGAASGPNHNNKLWAARASNYVPSADPNEPPTPPNTSAAILILSTGTLLPVGADGEVIAPIATQAGNNANGNPDGGSFPAPISPQHGSNNGQGGDPFTNCDLINDCSDSLHEQWFDLGWNVLADKLWLSFQVTPPPGVNGYMFDFAFFSSEYPTFVDTQFNDMFIAWSSSESYTGTLTFIGEAPMNATSLAKVGGFTYTGDDTELFGTGFESNAATSWLVARGPATPGQPIDVTFFLSDLGDALNASVVLLDNFRWDCTGCVGSSCGFDQ